MGAVARVVAGVGAALLLASGACFLWFEQMFDPADITMWAVGVGLVIGGLILATALMGGLGKD